MKKLIALVFLVIATTLNAQTFEADIAKAYNMFDTSKAVNHLLAASAALDLVTLKYPTELMANYYSAYSKAIISYRLDEKDKKRKDQYLDMANKYFEKVKEMAPEKDETYILAALLANARLSVDGGSRWKEFGEIFEKNMTKAKEINPNNPRIYYLRGVATFYTPKMFGGGSKNAKPFFEQAKPLFEAQDNSSVLKPIWGTRQNTEYMEMCDK